MKKHDTTAFHEAYTATDLDDVDRTTAENYAHCPAMARFIETGTVSDGGHLAQVGEEVHQAFGEVVRDYISSGGELDIGTLVESFSGRLRNARPDLQNDALASGRYAAYAWAKCIRSINPADIMRYDGGEGERSGQLAIDYEDFGIRYTSELDFLRSTASSEVLDEIDYKTGWKYHSVDEIASSFQFQSHAVLVLHNYPAINCLRVRVWNSRRGGLTYPVEFPRERMLEWECRIRSALEIYRSHRDVLPQVAEAWPNEKCDYCPAAVVCPAVDKVAIEKLSDPVAVVTELRALEVRMAALKKFADIAVQQAGKDIVTPAGYAYGYDKPKKATKPKRYLYDVKKAASDETDD